MAERGSAATATPKAAALSLTGQAELLRPCKENEQLRMDREIIKKAAVFFAKEIE
jgi:transposase